MHKSDDRVLVVGPQDVLTDVRMSAFMEARHGGGRWQGQETADCLVTPMQIHERLWLTPRGTLTGHDIFHSS